MNQKPKKAKVTKKRALIAYAEFWHTANMLIDAGNRKQKGWMHLFRAALVFRAFALEAALNHIGDKVIKCWGMIERKLGPDQKIALIAEQLKIPTDFGASPWQIVGELFRYRNWLAHGKTSTVEEVYEENAHEYMEPRFFEFTKADFEKFETEENLERVGKDTYKVITLLHEKAGIKDEIPFATGMQEASSTLLENP